MRATASLAPHELRNALLLSALDVINDARYSIQKSPPGVKRVTRGSLNNPPVREVNPSIPGNPPRTDLGRLVASINFEFEGANTILAGTDVDYGRHLEFARNPNLRRPWLGPAYKRQLKRIRQRFRNSVKVTLEKGTKK